MERRQDVIPGLVCDVIDLGVMPPCRLLGCHVVKQQRSTLICPARRQTTLLALIVNNTKKNDIEHFCPFSRRIDALTH